MNLFTVTKPTIKRQPILLSSPHSGTFIPKELEDQFLSEPYKNPSDTDWHIEKLYDFVPSIGATLIQSNFSRYVIDLNRDPKSLKLYNDKRSETSLIPTNSFAGEALYQEGKNPTVEETKFRLENWYWPYYKKIESLLKEIKDEFGYVIFYDCHSIKRVVKSIQDNPFPDLILGNQQGKTANEKISETALNALKQTKLDVSYNHPFQGGHLTRYFGKPENHIHGLQLEMSQDLYMDENTNEYDLEKANIMRDLLKNTIESIIKKADEIYA